MRGGESAGPSQDRREYIPVGFGRDIPVAHDPEKAQLTRLRVLQHQLTSDSLQRQFSPSDRSVALPPTAAVFVVMVCSVAKRGR